MAMFVVMGTQFFEGDATWARDNAELVRQQSEALAAQSSLVSPGLSQNIPSWFGTFEVNPTTGGLTLVSAWHLDEAGVVQNGLPQDLEPATPPA